MEMYLGHFCLEQASIFYNWESSRVPQEKLLRTVCCAGLVSSKSAQLLTMKQHANIFTRAAYNIAIYIFHKTDEMQ